jgi:predicted acyltransferase
MNTPLYSTADLPQDSSRIEPTRGTPPAQRLLSLDALRGFDMFWIVGAESLFDGLSHTSPTGVTKFLAEQLDHVEWEGFRFYDLIFPLFVFIVGVSIVFSLSRTIQQFGRAEALKRIVRRSILLFVLALIYSGGLTNPWPGLRVLGVLNRIALCYFFTGIIFCFVPLRGMIAACAALLAGYWAMMTFVPIRDIQLEKSHLQQLSAQTGITNAMTLFQNTTTKVTGAFDKGRNLANHLDFQYLPGKLYDTYWDPEGLLSTLPAIATCLLGVFAGLLLQTQRVPDQRKVICLMAGGVGAVVAGFLWGLQFPVIKKIWTSSYVLVAGGYSAILLAAFYQIIEIWNWRKWCQPFVWIGMNAITIYMANNIIGFPRLAARLAGGDVKNFLDTHIAAGAGDLFISAVALALAVWLVHFLYRRKIFLRV